MSPVLTCITETPIGDEEVAYDIGSASELTFLASIPTNSGGEEIVAGTPALSLLVTNPIAFPIIAEVTFRAPFARFIDPTDDPALEMAQRTTEFRWTDGGPVFSENQKYVAPISQGGAAYLSFDQISVTHRFEIAASGAETAEIIDTYQVSESGGGPASVLVSADTIGGYFISATGWLKQP